MMARSQDGVVEGSEIKLGRSEPPSGSGFVIGTKLYLVDRGE
jgi:hypothetical protein